MARRAACTALSSQMSMPTSMVGERYSTGRSTPGCQPCAVPLSHCQIGAVFIDSDRDAVVLNVTSKMAGRQDSFISAAVRASASACCHGSSSTRAPFKISYLNRRTKKAIGGLETNGPRESILGLRRPHRSAEFFTRRRVVIGLLQPSDRGSPHRGGERRQARRRGRWPNPCARGADR